MRQEGVEGSRHRVVLQVRACSPTMACRHHQCRCLHPAIPLQRLRQEVALLRAAQQECGDGGSGGEPDVQQALALNEELEERLAHLQEQLGRLRQ